MQKYCTVLYGAKFQMSLKNTLQTKGGRGDKLVLERVVMVELVCLVIYQSALNWNCLQQSQMVSFSIKTILQEFGGQSRKSF